jgi:hypothetical protein
VAVSCPRRHSSSWEKCDQLQLQQYHCGHELGHHQPQLWIAAFHYHAATLASQQPQPQRSLFSTALQEWQS